MINVIAKLLSYLPLSIIHHIGAAFGWLFHRLIPKTKAILVENLEHSGLFPAGKECNRAVKKNIAESGKTIIESLAIWAADDKRALGWIKQVNGWDNVELAVAKGKGIIFLTPHLGSFEITSVYYAAKYPITVLYRPPRKKWLEILMNKGRSKGQVSLAPTNRAGVKMLLQALTRGEAIGILPDQIASKGEGEWAPFFGRPAYTMALVSRLAEKTGATVLMAFGERLPGGQGFSIHLTKLEASDVATPALLNQAIEAQVRQAPLQYLWNYNRHKGHLQQDQPI
ncbi:MAG: lysophospholipid acyltransferase family protein [Methylococcaceae bacterium]|nr:lysophospholipid acyltransferase family protein [Methylococcaceae bacterium]